MSHAFVRKGDRICAPLFCSRTRVQRVARVRATRRFRGARLPGLPIGLGVRSSIIISANSSHRTLYRPCFVARPVTQSTDPLLISRLPRYLPFDRTGIVMSILPIDVRWLICRLTPCFAMEIDSDEGLRLLLKVLRRHRGVR
jgi:hypothetical protein